MVMRSVSAVETAGPQDAATSSMTVDISRYDETFRRLGQEAIACVPEEWTQGRLTMSCDGDSLQYRLKSDTNETLAEATQRLAELCGELYVLMEKDGQRWVSCVIEFTRPPGGTWGFDVRFTYPRNTEAI